MDGFQIAGASVPGMDHIKPGESGWNNNQDAFCWSASPRHLVAVVCDGCSSHARSEVGAGIGAQIIVNVASDVLLPAVQTSGVAAIAAEAFLRILMEETLNRIAIIARSMGGSFKDVIEEQFLFSTIGVIMTPETTFIFSCGDGVYAINGTVTTLGPYPGNEPPYLAYNLAPRAKGASPAFTTELVYSTKAVQSLLIGTDGVTDLINAATLPMPVGGKPVGPLSQFWENNLFFTNPDAVRRKLAKTNCETVVEGHIKRGLLRDDTTLVTIRRTPIDTGGTHA